MNRIDNIIITEIKSPVVVHSEKGREFQMTDRPNFGLSLCTSGQITYTMNGKTYISDPNKAVLLPQGGTYALYGDKEGLFPVLNFKCNCFHADTIMVFPLENPQVCVRDFEAIQTMFLHNKNRLMILSAFYKLLGEVSSAHSAKHDPLQLVTRYIETRISDPTLSNAELAQQMGISEVYCRKLFLAHHGITPKQYILDMRLRKAKQMLADTTFTVTAISEECGFSSIYHFCRAFKAKTGTTPTEYANRNRIYQM